jgi:hypothetical protein
MVQAIFEQVSTAQTFYSPEDPPLITEHGGHTYRMMGESYTESSLCEEKFLRILMLVGLIAAAIFTIIPFFFADFYTRLADLAIEVRDGTEKNIHWVILDPVFPDDIARQLIRGQRGIIGHYEDLMDQGALPYAMAATVCCILIRIGTDEIRQQFVIRKSGETNITHDDLLDRLEEFEVSLEKALAPSRHQHITDFSLRYVVTLQSMNNKDFFCVAGDIHRDAAGQRPTGIVDQRLQEGPFVIGWELHEIGFNLHNFFELPEEGD